MVTRLPLMFGSKVYQTRRQSLAQAVGSGTVLLLGASDAPMRYRANPYPFVQDGSFAYFFGIDLPDHAGLIDCDTGRSTLFGPEPNIDDLVWHGPQPSLDERAVAIGAESSDSLAALRDLLGSGRGTATQIHHLPPVRGETALLMSELLGIQASRLAATASLTLIDAIVTLRELKDEDEVIEMSRALETTARMHAIAAACARPGVYEHEVVAAMAVEVERDRRRFAYPPIFSRRGDVLHNMAHEGRLAEGDLVINDSGATSPMGYASDITRTLPIGGRFSARQRAIYDIVLSAQREAIAAIKPGILYRDIHILASRTIAEGLVALGVLRGDPEVLVSEGVHALFFPHGVGHQIGLDTHDMEALGEDRVGYGDAVQRSAQFGLNNLRLAKPLAPRMIVTVEPGIYFIQPLLDRWRQQHRFEGLIQWQNVSIYEGLGGVRLEDNILVTSSGAHKLGPEIPSDPEAVEAIMM